jgi:hypothetical protein
VKKMMEKQKENDERNKDLGANTSFTVKLCV